MDSSFCAVKVAVFTYKSRAFAFVTVFKPLAWCAYFKNSWNVVLDDCLSSF
jgi:hypothetical protein